MKHNVAICVCAAIDSLAVIPNLQLLSMWDTNITADEALIRSG